MSEEVQPITMQDIKRTLRRPAFWICVGMVAFIVYMFRTYDHPSSPAPKQAEQVTYSSEMQKLVDQFGAPPEQTGSRHRYIPVEIYLEQVMNDPGSLEMEGCGEVRHTKQGWLVSCSYRGKNAFGATILDGGWFTIRYGQVIKAQPLSAYR
ncbi:MAG: hypothetical protein J0M34_08300 [Alphaproteobacteria bacterium]|nr:hypothetical protein [Alphaproteobacteria bacterium]